MSSASLKSGPIWNMVKASLPKGASDSEIWKKTDQVLKEHNMSWASARKDETTNGKAAPREQIYQELLGKKSSDKGKVTQTDTATPKNEGLDNNNGLYDPFALNWNNYTGTSTGPYNWNNYGAGNPATFNYGAGSPNSFGGYVNQLVNQQQQMGVPSYTGFNSYLSGQGANSNSSGQLASRTGNYINAMVGRSFLPQYQYTDMQTRSWLT